ncbi:hypothetical protein O9K51_06495 [Purpureocillium lavendulum]|uniref:Uncharacterized protein n=1 Tax=Purpureocillium lavendulum TaxID=1247861 RepID=A0AB34FP31_9HYPO|nr:hypothetical protein O9K51_06495 [Purpureocillium lavendulum]
MAVASAAASILTTAVVSFFRPLFNPVDESLGRLVAPSREDFQCLKSSLLLKAPYSPPPSPSPSPKPQQQLDQRQRQQQRQKEDEPQQRAPRRRQALALPTVAVVLAAVLLNHIRRVLAPWLGQFVWRHPFETMKLARSSPCYMLEASVAAADDDGQPSSWWWAVVRWGLQVRLLSALREVLMRKMRASAAAEHHGSRAATTTTGVDDDGDTASAAAAGEGSALDDVLFDACRIVYLATSIALLEGAYAETCWAVAHIYALLRTTTSLLPGDSVMDAATSRAFVLNDVLAAHWPRAVFQACLLAQWAARTLLPTTAWMAARAAARVDVYTPAAAYALWAGTALLVRKSNKYFMLLEMSGMLVTFGWMALGLGVVAVWKAEQLAARWERRGVGRRR